MLLPARPPCPPRALLRCTRLLTLDGAASEWRFRELEGYRPEDVVTSEFHDAVTRDVPPGHLAIVRQGHGRISLVLVCAHGFTILVRQLGRA